MEKEMSDGDFIAGKRDALLGGLIIPKQGSMSEVESGTDYPIRNGEQTSLRSHESGHNVTGPVILFTYDIFPT